MSLLREVRCGLFDTLLDCVQDFGGIVIDPSALASTVAGGADLHVYQPWMRIHLLELHLV